MSMVENSIEAALNPDTDGAQDAFTERMRTELGYLGAKKLEDGTYVGVQRLLYTLAICVGVSEIKPYERRYCYDNAAEALWNYQSMCHRDFEPCGYVATRP